MTCLTACSKTFTPISPSSAPPKNHRCPSSASAKRPNTSPTATANWPRTPGAAPASATSAAGRWRAPSSSSTSSPAASARPAAPPPTAGTNSCPNRTMRRPPGTAWNELQLPHEWPFALYEMSFLLPHFLEEGRGEIDVYFTRVYNPMWINPDGFMWLKALQRRREDEVPRRPHAHLERVRLVCRLRAAHGPRRRTARPDEPGDARRAVDRLPPAGAPRGHGDAWAARSNSPTRPIPAKSGKKTNSGFELSARMDPDGELGIRQHFESPYRPGEIITNDEYYRWIFENSVPGLPEAAAQRRARRRWPTCTSTALSRSREDNYAPYEKMPAETPKQAEVARPMTASCATAKRSAC